MEREETGYIPSSLDIYSMEKKIIEMEKNFYNGITNLTGHPSEQLY